MFGEGEPERCAGGSTGKCAGHSLTLPTARGVCLLPSRGE
jgi:hypothetical protein